MSTIIPNTIIMWSGAIVDIPEGWFLCDGANGTPDLRNRFVIGAGSTYSLDATGGSADAIVPSHSHTNTSISSGGNHSHTFSGGVSDFQYPTQQSTVPGQEVNDQGAAATNTSYSEGFGGTHSHSGGTMTTTGSSGTNANLPPYYALAFIMKGE